METFLEISLWWCIARAAAAAATPLDASACAFFLEQILGLWQSAGPRHMSLLIPINTTVVLVVGGYPSVSQLVVPCMVTLPSLTWVLENPRLTRMGLVVVQHLPPFNSRAGHLHKDHLVFPGSSREPIARGSSLRVQADPWNLHT